MEWNSLLSTVRVRELMGGRPSSKLDSELRTEFDRDYDRAAFSAPVRRLQDKAQVFPLEPNDSVRTRLTHSLEVSTLARALGRQAEGFLLKAGELPNEHRGSVEAIAATCGLIHDLGNPPFGHAGETAISDWFRERSGGSGSSLAGLLASLGGSDTQSAQDFLKFEGNAQTIRIVSRLQVLADRFGLNLTAGTMSAALKYVAPSNETHEKVGGHHEWTKPGYFKSEAPLIEKIREVTKTGVNRNPITYLVEAADDIVYALVDIEDGVKKRVVSWDAVATALKGSVDAGVLADCTSYVGKILDRGEHPLQVPNEDEMHAQAFRTAAISVLTRSVMECYVSRYDSIKRGAYHGEIVADCSASSLIRACKDIAAKHVYTARETLERELAGRKVIHDLLDLFWEAAKGYNGITPKTKTFAGKLYLMMSENYRVVFEDRFPKGENRDYCRMQLVTDYICGMTDGYACKLHRTLGNV